MRYFRKIVGERLYLSPFDPDEEELHTKWAEWMNSRSVADTYGGYFNLVSVSSAKKTLAEFQGYRFAMVLHDGDVFIGHISLHDIDHLHRHAFLGIFVGDEEHRNKGYGAEAVRLVLGYGFNTLNLHSIMLSVHADYKPAIACYTKAGFRAVGRRREWVFKNGAYIDVVYMEILEEEFRG